MPQPSQDQPAQPQAGAFHVEQPPPSQAVSAEPWAAYPPIQGPYAGQPLPAPTQVAYAGQPRYYPHPRAGQLGLSALVLAGIVTLLEIAEGAVAWSSEGLYKEAAAQGVAAADVMTPLDVVGIPLGLAQFVAWVVTAIWLTQARENAEALHPMVRHARSKVWAWLGWIVPFVSFWFPYQYVRDVRSATFSDERKYSTVVGRWWAAWLVYVVSQTAGTRMMVSTEGYAASGLAEWESLNAVFAIVALAFWVRVVTEVRQDQQAVALGRPTVAVVGPSADELAEDREVDSGR